MMKNMKKNRRDVKFALGKKNINFWCLPIHRCRLALYTQYFPESCEQISQAYYSDGTQTHDTCNSRAWSHQLDYRDSSEWVKTYKESDKMAFVQIIDIDDPNNVPIRPVN